jgi:microcystin-dependent protein
MSNYEATRYDFDGASLTGIEGINTGIIIPWSDLTPPSGFLECNGSAISRVTYAALFAVIGTTYGSGNGSTTFDLPDLTDKSILGRSNTKVLASTGGANTVTTTGNISGSASNTTLSTGELATHTHPHSSAAAGGILGNPGGSRKEVVKQILKQLVVVEHTHIIYLLILLVTQIQFCNHM